MRIIFSILFGVFFALLGARLAGWLGDALLDLKTFESPDQVATFQLIAQLGITALVAVVGVMVGLLVAARLRPRLFRKEG
jgi:hypothetical protein